MYKSQTPEQERIMLLEAEVQKKKLAAMTVTETEDPPPDTEDPPPPAKVPDEPIDDLV
jgi:hypothetical protein